MKVILLLVALLIFSPLNAGADTVDLYSAFPDTQGGNNLWAVGYNKLTGTARFLADTGPYEFSTIGQGGIPSVSKGVDYILMNPSFESGTMYGAERAILAWNPQATTPYLVDLSGSFKVAGVGGEVKAHVGIYNTIGSNDYRVEEVNQYSWKTIVINDLLLNPGDKLYFAVSPNGTEAGDLTYFYGSISSQAVPVPPALLLFGSGLLGLGVWRRFRKS